MTDPTEINELDQFRWWPLAEMAVTTERRMPCSLSPLSLAEIVAQYLEHGAPQQPLDLESAVD
jgi:hypothetical protein